MDNGQTPDGWPAGRSQTQCCLSSIVGRGIDTMYGSRQQHTASKICKSAAE